MATHWANVPSNLSPSGVMAFSPILSTVSPAFAHSTGLHDPSRSPHQQSCGPQHRLRLLRVAASPEVAIALAAWGTGPSRTTVHPTSPLVLHSRRAAGPADSGSGAAPWGGIPPGRALR